MVANLVEVWVRAAGGWENGLMVNGQWRFIWGALVLLDRIPVVCTFRVMVAQVPTCLVSLVHSVVVEVEAA